jgi:hypothetical protein
MPFKPFVFAATVASQRELFQAPLSARTQAFRQPYQAAAVSPVAGTAAALPHAAVWTELAYSSGTETVEIREDAWSPTWLGFGVVAAAAVAGASIRRAPTKTKRSTVADQLIAGMAEQRFHAAAAAENKLAMLALGGEPTKAFDGVAFAKTLPGITGEDLWDPGNYCSANNITEGKIRFYREVELKHGRLAMLASLGFIVGENYHPLFGGDIDVPSYLAFQQTPLETFWPAVVFAIAIPEIYSVQTFNPPTSTDRGQRWTIRSDHEAGDLGFDPLDLKPLDPDELKEMQTRELTYGRWAMLATAVMVLEEVATGSKLELGF